jgi:hypothetical protein
MAARHRIPLRPGAIWLLGLATLAPTAGRAADGLSLDRDRVWPRWQARLSIIETTDLAPTQRAALLGDYDLGTFGLSLPFASGRFRATSGLLFGMRTASSPSAWMSALGADGAVPSAPYIGLGYTGWVPKTGLSFTADVGFSADYPGGTWRFGRALLGNQGFDATLRELRLQPRLQLGVQYTY